MSQIQETVIEAGWIIPVKPAEVVLRGHAVVVAGDRIREIIPTRQARERYPDARRVDLAGHVLIPGLINLHTHAAMTLMRGLGDDLALMEWLNQHIWPTEVRLASPEFV
jgi:5-methylthioadenosine/S-adenosylhomocysteine deaminase